jgi:hypothetical protein
MQDLMDTLLVTRKKVPKGSGVLQVRLWVSLLGMDEGGELHTVSNKEYWRVIANHIPVPFLSIKLDRKSMGIARSVGRPLFAPDGRESNGDFGLLADFAEDIGITLIS